MSVFLSFWWVTCLSSPPPFFFLSSFFLGKPGSPHLRSFFLGGWLPISFFRTGSWLPPSFLPLSFSFLSFKGVAWLSPCLPFFVSFFCGDPGSPPLLYIFLGGGLALPLPSVLGFFLSGGTWQFTPPFFISGGVLDAPPPFFLCFFLSEGSWLSPFISFFRGGLAVCTPPFVLYLLLFFLGGGPGCPHPPPFASSPPTGDGSCILSAF